MHNVKDFAPEQRLSAGEGGPRAAPGYGNCCGAPACRVAMTAAWQIHKKGVNAALLARVIWSSRRSAAVCAAQSGAEKGCEPFACHFGPIHVSSLECRCFPDHSLKFAWGAPICGYGPTARRRLVAIYKHRCRWPCS